MPEELGGKRQAERRQRGPAYQHRDTATLLGMLLQQLALRPQESYYHTKYFDTNSLRLQAPSVGLADLLLHGVASAMFSQPVCGAWCLVPSFDGAAPPFIEAPMRRARSWEPPITRDLKSVAQGHARVSRLAVDIAAEPGIGVVIGLVENVVDVELK